MINKNFKIGIITAAAIFSLNQCSYAEIALNLEDTEKHKIELSAPAQEINDNLFSSQEEMLKFYLENQKKLDIDDIKTLWDSTVKRNPVISFSLQKLSLPPEKRRINSSRMTKTIATLIRGAAMVPGMLGADPVTSSASTVSGGLAGRYITEKNMPKEMPMTDTELIQLARLVDDLQDKVIKNYYEYKANLDSYKSARDNTENYNKKYSDALDSGDVTTILTAGTLYNNATRTESSIKQKIKLNRLNLERLAGEESINTLKLGKAFAEEPAEQEIKQESEQKADPQTPENTTEAKCCDVDTKPIAQEIAAEMSSEKQELLADLQILWAAAVENSETIRFAIVKLSNPEGEAEKKSAIKTILSPLASVAPIVGLGLSDPVTAGTTMFSGNLLNSMLSDDSKINSYLSKVTDADLVMLAQETDSLQEKLIILYHDYLSALMDFKFIEDIEQNSMDTIELVKNSKPEYAPVAEVFYNQIHDQKDQAKQKVLSTRVSLEQFTGNEALLLVDKNIYDRMTYNHFE